ncbi:conserved hypothetical protein (plasmid) [Beijerinckia indica subsp. indica ATCC 9039]|uniref:Uncharacterized protein n=1 Tax=Beijerinckia indica subsp. indica (strain ATCC 9039 / DSM 1715 / NCIMB 8712) TaxID=395963 RepID=B2ILH2_BEII9|nr:conserved hypothetical protein [Beijerinckia indica subsp. indica ATCC 9039]
MRVYAFVIFTAAFFVLPIATFAQEVELGPGGVRVEPFHQGRSAWHPNCGELRRACLYKEELGEEGRGNCERYRHFCRSH